MRRTKGEREGTEIEGAAAAHAVIVCCTKGPYLPSDEDRSDAERRAERVSEGAHKVSGI